MWAGTGTCKHSPARNQPRERGMGPVLSRLSTGRGVAGRDCRPGSGEPVAPPIHQVQLVLPQLRHGGAGPSRCPAETFWGKSPVTVAVKRHSWGLFPPRLGCKASMRGCGCAWGWDCGALPTSIGSWAGLLCPGVLEGAKETFILITAGLRKERAFHFVLGTGKSLGAAAPGALETGGAGDLWYWSGGDWCWWLLG